MAYQAVFKRYELKYLLTVEQKAKIVAGMAPYMALDSYGHTLIRNLYYDTDNYRLIRHSIEKPAYKEKLRIRSYGAPRPDETVYVELKKKYQDVVYKRRLPLTEELAKDWLSGQTPGPDDSQIAREITYTRDFYETLHPVLFLSYEREAYYAKDGSDFRVTIDDHLQCRQDELTLSSTCCSPHPSQETPSISLLDENLVLMELKCSGGIPLWMTEILSKERIYKTSFSKYGTAYRELIFPQIQQRRFFT